MIIMIVIVIINVFRVVFVRYGLFYEVVSDNGF